MRLKLKFTSSICSFDCNLFPLAFHVFSNDSSHNNPTTLARNENSSIFPIQQLHLFATTIAVFWSEWEKNTRHLFREENLENREMRGGGNWRKTAFQLFQHDFPHEPNFMLKRLKWLTRMQIPRYDGCSQLLWFVLLQRALAFHYVLLWRWLHCGRRRRRRRLSRIFAIEIIKQNCVGKLQWARRDSPRMTTTGKNEGVECSNSMQDGEEWLLCDIKNSWIEGN